MSDSYDLVIYQGLPFQIPLNLSDDDGVPLNLSGCSVYSSNIRERYGDTGILDEFIVTFVDPLVNGNLIFSLTSGQTDALPVTQGVYNIEIYDTGTQDVIKILDGYISILPKV
jgi:hypothetical protein